MDGLITCFRCTGEGIIYKYEGELGTKRTCPGCLGRGSLIANSCLQCIKCRGKGQVYEYDDELGQRYECPLCNNVGYTMERYLECPKCKGGGRIYPFQEEKLGVPKGCIPCGAIGYIKEKDYHNINFNQNNYYSNKPKYPIEAGNYTIHGATQGQYNPLENGNMVWQKMPTEEEYSVGENSIYGDNNIRQRSNTDHGYKYPLYPNNNYNNNYNNCNNNDYNHGMEKGENSNGGLVNSGNIYHSQNQQNYNNYYNMPQSQNRGGYHQIQNPGGYPQVQNQRGYPQVQNPGGYTQVQNPGVYPQFNDTQNNGYNQYYNNGGYY